MAIPQALSEVDGFDYVMKDNRKDPVEDQVVFQLIGLRDRERTLARNKLLSDDPTMEALDLTVSLGLKGWSDNFKKKNKQGELVACPYPSNGRKAVALVGEIITQELGMAIMAASEIGEHDAGN